LGREATKNKRKIEAPSEKEKVSPRTSHLSALFISIAPAAAKRTQRKGLNSLSMQPFGVVPAVRWHFN